MTKFRIKAVYPDRTVSFVVYARAAGEAWMRAKATARYALVIIVEE